jgi:hypothetical protein
MRPVLENSICGSPHPLRNSISPCVNNEEANSAPRELIPGDLFGRLIGADLEGPASFTLPCIDSGTHDDCNLRAGKLLRELVRDELGLRIISGRN